MQLLVENQRQKAESKRPGSAQSLTLERCNTWETRAEEAELATCPGLDGPRIRP